MSHKAQLDAILVLLTSLTLTPTDIIQLSTAIRATANLPTSTLLHPTVTFDNEEDFNSLLDAGMPIVPSPATRPALFLLAATQLSQSSPPTIMPASAPATAATAATPAPLPTTVVLPSTTTPPHPILIEIPAPAVVLLASEVVNINRAATTLPHLPVTTLNFGGEVWYQQTYRSFTFDVPRAGDLRPFYLVTRGHRVGVFSTWQHTSIHVTSISCSSFSCAKSLNNALLWMLDAIDLREVEWLH
ncbi:hypothetical protein BS17DRAFT_767573 [Gyrodon lividus]|nr:hypothetical protein BS17DRAFT_767573 [Gyrodon lividus]